MKRNHYSEICEKLGLEYSGYIVMDEGAQLSGALEGDRMLFHEGLAKVRMITPDQQYNLSDENYSKEEFIRLCHTIETYKSGYGLLDFNDMLLLGLKERSLPAFDVLIIDEAQDLSKLQWAVVYRLIQNAGETYVAGDDDQAIFKWAGADPESFISLPGSVVTLEQSFRLSAPVHEIAGRIIRNCSRRREKLFRPASHSGKVQFVFGPEELDLSQGNWLVLARNTYLLTPFEELCETEGYAYHSKKSPLQPEVIDTIKLFEAWRAGKIKLEKENIDAIRKYVPNFNPATTYPIWHESFRRLGKDVRDYFVAARRRGESLNTTPRIRLSTIHGAKGGEADNVVVLSDMSYKSFEQFNADPDDEIRVFYVAATRARNNLYIMDPQSQNAFNLW